ncbi:MAG: hypothetical protein ACTSVI_07250 [Promethearchaeota archaeon]
MKSDVQADINDSWNHVHHVLIEINDLEMNNNFDLTTVVQDLNQALALLNEAESYIKENDTSKAANLINSTNNILNNIEVTLENFKQLEQKKYDELVSSQVIFIIVSISISGFLATFFIYSRKKKNSLFLKAKIDYRRLDGKVEKN